MVLYELKTEDKKTILVVKADDEGMKTIENKFNKKIKELNKELKEKGYFEFGNKKIYFSQMFLD